MSVFKWCGEFKNSHTSVNVDRRSGRPIVTDKIVEKIKHGLFDKEVKGEVDEGVGGKLLRGRNKKS